MRTSTLGAMGFLLWGTAALVGLGPRLLRASRTPEVRLELLGEARQLEATLREDLARMAPGGLRGLDPSEGLQLLTLELDPGGARLRPVFVTYRMRSGPDGEPRLLRSRYLRPERGPLRVEEAPVGRLGASAFRVEVLASGPGGPRVLRVHLRLWAPAGPPGERLFLDTSFLWASPRSGEESDEFEDPPPGLNA